MSDTPTRSPAILDEPHAPVIFFDAVPSFGYLNGILTITLSAVRPLADGQGRVVADHLVVAHLKCTPMAANELQRSIDDAVLLGVRREGRG